MDEGRTSGQREIHMGGTWPVLVRPNLMHWSPSPLPFTMPCRAQIAKLRNHTTYLFLRTASVPSQARLYRTSSRACMKIERCRAHPSWLWCNTYFLPSMLFLDLLSVSYLECTDHFFFPRRTLSDIQLFENQSVVEYWENFATHAFENTTQSVYSHCILLKPSGAPVPATFCFSIRRDIFDLPSLVIGELSVFVKLVSASVLTLLLVGQWLPLL